MNERQKYKWKQDLSWLKNRIKFKINRIFFMTQDKMVMFESYHGKRCGDSVRAIYEEMLKDDTFRDYTFVWAFSKPSEHEDLLENPHTLVVKKGSAEYFRYYAAARFGSIMSAFLIF